MMWRATSRRAPSSEWSIFSFIRAIGWFWMTLARSVTFARRSSTCSRSPRAPASMVGFPPPLPRNAHPCSATNDRRCKVATTLQCGALPFLGVGTHPASSSISIILAHGGGARLRHHAVLLQIVILDPLPRGQGPVAAPGSASRWLGARLDRDLSHARFF